MVTTEFKVLNNTPMSNYNRIQYHLNAKGELSRPIT
jgi:hypothetical protein